jgi:UDP-GlcNAc:undecaprenyl-phosphate GlcNAc-1-phosphate transferase
MLFILLTGLAVALLVTPLVVRVASKRGLFDQPGDPRRMHARPIPRLGGIAVFTATMIALLVAALQMPLAPHGRQFLVAILLGGGGVFAAGLVDDVRGLRALTKLAVECVAAFAVCLLGLQIDVIGLGPAGVVATGPLAVPLTVLWVVGVTNAFNLVDGLDGLATGIAIVALGTVLVTAQMFGDPAVVVGCVALLGALLGFGRFNLPPARIFLGDSGSLFVGFFVAVLSLNASIKSTTVVLVLVPLFALAIPLIDMSLAIARRWLRGKPIFGADASHIHHRLLALGLTPPMAVGVLVLMAMAFALVGMVVVFTPQQAQLRIGLIGGTVALAMALFGIRRLKYTEFDEAASTVADVVHARRIVHERICAREAARQIANAQSLAQVNHILQDSAAELRYIRMELVRAGARANGVGGVAASPGTNGAASHAWVLECPVPDCHGAPASYVLSISGDPSVTRAGYGVERVAHLLTPTLQAWAARSSWGATDVEVPITHATDRPAGEAGFGGGPDDRRLPRDGRPSEPSLPGLRLADLSPTAEQLSTARPS